MEFYNKNFIDKLSKSKAVVGIIERRMARNFKSSIKKFQQDFLSHKVTQEMLGEGAVNNISGTLPNATEGSLWGFLGFEKGQSGLIIGEIVKQIEGINYYKNGRIYSRAAATKGGLIGQRFRISIPKFGRPLLWDQTQNWTDGIEQGISGLQHFIYSGNMPNSRSGAGLQKKKQIRNSSMKPVEYLTPLKKEFLDKLTK